MKVHVLFDQFFLPSALVLILGLTLKLYNALVLKPRCLRSALSKQGIRGPPPTFLLGNILEIKRARISATKAEVAAIGPPVEHNCEAAILPVFDQWKREFGGVFMFSLGNMQVLHVKEYELVREITLCTSMDIGKPSYQAKDLHSLLGDGILTSNGEFWAHQRKILAPELFMDKVKGMISMVEQCTLILVQSWKDLIEAKGGVAEIKIDHDLRKFAGDVISRACFGSSYSEGEELFNKLRALQEVSSKRGFFLGVPGMRHIPTKNNREAWRLDSEIRRIIKKLVKEKHVDKVEKNLLENLVERAESSDLSQDGMERFVVDNCKNVYLAGYETTACVATWCFILLASNQEWQDRVRDEVLEFCQGQVLDFNSIKKMKQLTMVINESLRLYPPVPVLSREALKDIKFGNINIPKGVTMWTLVTTLHTDPDIWGPDSYRFNPDRFANGVTGACKLPHLYMPFGAGPRTCLGQNLAMVELKLLISIVVSNFSFRLSPKYVHSPTVRLVIEPEFGADLLMEKLKKPPIVVA